MELERVLRMRKSVRKFTDEQVSEEELEKILLAANAAPIAGGDYSKTHITILQDPKTLSEVKEACEVISRKTGKPMDPYYGAPTVLFLSAADVSDDHIEYCNVACIIENILLQATELNLGSVFIWGCLGKLRSNKEALKKLTLPQGHEILCGVAIGHPAKPLEERTIEEKLSTTRI